MSTQQALDLYKKATFGASANADWLTLDGLHHSPDAFESVKDLVEVSRLTENLGGTFASRQLIAYVIFNASQRNK